jgi:hypothetical protein
MIKQYLIQLKKTQCFLIASFESIKDGYIAIQEAEEIVNDPDSFIANIVRARENIVMLKARFSKEVLDMLKFFKYNITPIKENKISFIKRKYLEFKEILSSLDSNFDKLKSDVSNFSKPGFVDTQAEYERLLTFQKSIYSGVKSLLGII